MNNEFFDISVIMPLYNTETYLRTAIDSILTNSQTKIEIILINDGSTDSSEEICLSYVSKFDNVRYFKQENAGQGAARNLGLNIAKGKYIYFMDSDDYLEVDALDKLYSLANDGDFEGVFFDAEVFFDSEMNLNDKFPIGNEKNYQRPFSLGTFQSGQDLLETFTREYSFTVSPCLYFVRRDVIEEAQLRFPEGIIHEDQYFAIMMLLNLGKCKHINNRYFKRRIRKSSTMTSQNYGKNLKGYATNIILLDNIVDKTIFSNYSNEEAYLKQLYNLYIAFIKYFKKSSVEEKDNHKEIINKTFQLVKNKYKYFNWRGKIATYCYGLFKTLAKIKTGSRKSTDE